MAEIVKRNKALSVNPLKSSQTIGAALAFLGMNRAVPMLHGSQGCTAFGKVFFVRHFREPIPLQTTAMDQVSTVMGAQDSIIQGLKTLCEKSAPDLIGLPTTGLAETQGADVEMAVRDFRQAHPEFDRTAVVPVSTPDYKGCLETGFALAVAAMVRHLVPEKKKGPGAEPSGRVNVLTSSQLTPGDLEELEAMIEGFGLTPVILPHLGDALDGHLIDQESTPLTMGGASVQVFETLHQADATLVIGASMNAAADLLKAKTGVPDYRFTHLLGLDAVDGFVAALHQISGRPAPARLERWRSQLQDAMLDSHFMLGQTRFAVAADPDQLKAFGDLLTGMGAELSVAVAAANAPVLAEVPAAQVKIGDLEDLETLARETAAECLIGNAHCAASAARLGVPLLRAGFPLYDRVGAYARTWIGYRGTRQALFDLANLLLDLERGEIAPYRSIYAPTEEVNPHAHPAPLAGGGRSH